MPQPLYTYVVKNPKTIHDDFLRTMKNGLVQKGLLQPNVNLSGDYDVLGTALSYEAAVAQANATILADQHMPDTATTAPVGSTTPGFLNRWGGLFGLQPRPAIPSRGLINVACSVASTSIATNAQLTDTAGLRYQVTVGGTYTATAGIITGIPVQALDAGSATNHNNGDTLKWTGQVPAFCAQNASVGTPNGTDGLSGGADSEIGQDELFRARILPRMANPSGGGNWSQVQAWAAASSPFVQLACVYPALNGPSTVYFAVSAAPQTTPPYTSTSRSRVISATTVSNTILPYVQGLLPEHVYVVGLSTVDQPTDVAVQLSLPAATTASPPGPGGGWLDGTPWPSTNAGTPCSVTVTSPQNFITFTVNAQTAPSIGSHIAFLSPSNWTLYSATVASFTGSTGAYVITIDTPFPGIAVNNYIFPQSVNQQTYVNAFLNAMASMGPGEWSSNPNIVGSGPLQRGFRHPQPSSTNPYSLGAQQLKQVILSGPEVLDAAYFYRSSTTPTVPANLGLGPNVLTPRNVGFYQS